MGAGLSEMEQQIRESRISLEKDIEALSELLARLGKEAPRLGPEALGPWGTSRIGSSCELQSWGRFPPCPHHHASRIPIFAVNHKHL